MTGLGVWVGLATMLVGVATLAAAQRITLPARARAVVRSHPRDRGGATRPRALE